MMGKIIRAKYISIKKLTHYKKNPRKISKENMEILKRSLKRFTGLFESRPCLVNRLNGKLVVYAGNQRMTACEQLGMKKIPCIVKSIPLEKMKGEMLTDNISLGDFIQEMLLDDFKPEQLEKFGMPTALFEGMAKKLGKEREIGSLEDGLELTEDGEESDIAMVQLFFTAKQKKRFDKWVRMLSRKDETITTCVYRIIKKVKNENS